MNDNSNPPNLFYTTEEVAKILKCGKTTVHYLVKKGKLNPVQLVKGGKRLFPTQEIEKIATIP
ncbi:hypothetical protein BEH94_09190 [Candidatus Altiarchaeales archaeon WOR_SM1_SCG]|nr:hypothetical protein BEH94_09190 [Candidatus Altiarchaeales archaeon WOR_SM1_SCG]